MRRGPSTWWYAIPAALVAGGLVLVAVVIVLMRSSLEIANGGDAVGSNKSGVSVVLVSGYRYQVFRESGPAATRKATCTVAATVESDGVPVNLGEASKGYSDDRVSSNGKEFVFLGDFVAPSSGQARISCPGQSATLLVRPDDRPFLTLGLVILIALVLAGAALVAFVVVLVLRVRRAREARQAAYAWPYAASPPR